LKDGFKSLLTNQYFSVFTLWFTSILIDTNTGNKYIANVLLIITFLALLRAVLKDFLGIETPYLKPLFKFLKFNRVLEKVDDTEQFYQDMEKNYYQVKELIVEINRKGKMRMFFKKIGQWIYANKITLSGFLATILLGVEIVFNISTKLNWDQEWYYTAIAALFILAEFAVFGRGAETIQKFANIKDEKAKTKELQEQRRKEEKVLQEAMLQMAREYASKNTPAEHDQEIRLKR
jgi:hypothetical protein